MLFSLKQSPNITHLTSRCHQLMSLTCLIIPFKAHQLQKKLCGVSSWCFCDSVSFFFVLLPAGLRAAAAAAATAADLPATHLCTVSAGHPGATGHGWRAALLRSTACQPAHHHEVIKTYQQTGKALSFLGESSDLINISDTS